MPPLTLFYAGGVTALLSPSPAANWKAPPWSTSCQRLPKHPPVSKLTLLAKGCWRRQRLHQAKQKNPKTWEWNSATSSVGNLMPETGLSSCEGFEMGMRARQGRKLPGGGWAAPCPQLRPLCFVRPPQLCEQSPVHQPSLRISCFLSAHIPGTVVWNTALIMEVAEKKPLPRKHVPRCFSGFPAPGLLLWGDVGYWDAKRHAKYLTGSQAG